jgi:hypothetical protein
VVPSSNGLMATRCCGSMRCSRARPPASRVQHGKHLSVDQKAPNRTLG